MPQPHLWALRMKSTGLYTLSRTMLRYSLNKVMELQGELGGADVHLPCFDGEKGRSEPKGCAWGLGTCPKGQTLLGGTS